MIDEWYSVEPFYAKPLSQFLTESLGTNDVACILGLIEEARRAQSVFAADFSSTSQEGRAALRALRLALKPFDAAHTASNP